jgi:hypothetical protein
MRVVFHARLAACDGCHGGEETARGAMCRMCWGSCGPREAIKTLVYRHHAMRAFVAECYPEDATYLLTHLGSGASVREPSLYFSPTHDAQGREREPETPSVTRDVDLFLAGATGEDIAPDHRAAMIEWVMAGGQVPGAALHEVALEMLDHRARVEAARPAP